MRLLSRYVVREHVGPLVFALTALTSLLMLQYVARQLANLAGKGLPWSAIGQFFVLSLPFTIAMTLPMAVLVATLYAFGRMAAEHEITAFKASGVRVRSLMAPVLFCALLLSIAMVWFNDRVLPAANHRLRVLQQDIARTKPTLALRDQVLNQLTESFFMRVSRSNAETNQMWDVVIYDLSRGPERKTIYADSGVFSLASNGQDMQMQLYDGHVQEFVRGDARKLQRTYFSTQTVRVRNIARNFETSKSDNMKGDREMSICEMQRKYVTSSLEYARLREEYIQYAGRLLKPGEAGVRVPRERARRVALADLYCSTLPSLFRVKTAKAQSAPRAVAQPPVTRDSTQRVQQSPAVVTSPAQPPAGQPPAGQPPVPVPATQPPVQPPAQPTTQPPTPPGAPGTTVIVVQPGVVPQPVVPQPGVPQPASQAAVPVPTPTVMPVPPATTLPQPADSAINNFAGAANMAGIQMNEARESLDSLNVEIQKKFALSFACFVFVLFGPPIALRFPRGGVGVTLGVSIVVFGLYYICLMAGETLADKGRLPPPVAMWIANVVFSVIGITLLWRVESTTDSSRGGGIRDWWADRKARRAVSRTVRTTDMPAAEVPA
jgi:lipopolysaccharide export system permease protein